jgi:hypothetical protein
MSLMMGEMMIVIVVNLWSWNRLEMEFAVGV